MDKTSNCRDYEFPFEPYGIQLQLMDTIYKSIDEGKIAIIESPTGTGKSLSIICSALKWIEDHRANHISQLTKEIENLKLSCDNDNSSDWVQAQSKQISDNLKMKDHEETLDKINKHLSYSKELRKKAKIRRFREVTNADSKDTSTKRQSECDILDEEDELIVKYCDDEDVLELVDEEKKWDNFYKPKIYYCSRTHSQLSQFINEIKKTKKYKNEHDSLMLVPLSSRVNYCVNPDVNRFSNVNVINEKCKELMNGKKKCCMNKPTLIQQLNEEILGTVQDLEDIVSKGKQLKACPYYASRLTLTEAEIVILPYNILLHKGTRDSFGVYLKDSVIIIDEAHNLLETMANVYSIEICQRQLKTLQSLLTKYMTKYYSRFNPLNIMYLKQLIFILKRLQLSLSKAPAGSKQSFSPLEFVLKLEIERINIYKLAEFIDKSHIASKLYMFSLKPPKEEVVKKAKISGTLAFLNKFKHGPTTILPKVEKEITEATNLKENTEKVVDSSASQEPFNSNMLYTLKELLFALKDYSVEGKILLNIDQTNPADSTCKYLLLNSSSHFEEIIRDCRSVILCGGTMKPFEDYINQLFKPLNIPDDRILTFSCEHVIENDHLIAIGCGRGPNNVELNFTYSSRSLPATIDETGRAVLKYCQTIPKGVVVFFPSYDYADIVLKRWQETSILKQIESCKRVFKEPKKATLTAAVLNSYTRVNKANNSNGAVIFSVIGGKMSEGINFSDDLGRGVIVIGLPYANKNSPELKEKMAFLDRTSAGLANEYYENQCMRAVNQSIGRSIRHKDDYAAIILLDSRYCTKQSVKTKLSDWIKNRYSTCDHFSMSLSQVEQFFKSKK